ncbi:hypothetical protein LEP1GSC050_0667 [Leptospira broomii serovar Hurstbridge str. 5399]|uniref:Uncharacterized protein n=1 Tax=Leptospira broomii serovar Hurstbridge str. 5399 TaxID=1049789 RepID=T0FFQ2_9LEPT|nr:hypothetical protein LEP1GSC050_0667 [Leptospira broomii serovar Hurstbridge str. 5399]
MYGFKWGNYKINQPNEHVFSALIEIIRFDYSDMNPKRLAKFEINKRVYTLKEVLLKGKFAIKQV